MSIIAQSIRRVENQSGQDVNARIKRETEASIAYYSSHPEQIGKRLVELDREWDIERLLQLNSSALSLLGLVLARRSSKWLLLPIAVQSFFLQHGLQGWCPPLPVLRAAGIRTSREIQIERHALKALRGDYRDSGKTNDAAALLRASASDGTPAYSPQATVVTPTVNRVPLNTTSALNERIEHETEGRLRSLAAHGELRDNRLRELDREWEIERVIEVEAPAMTLTGLVLGLVSNRKWLALPLFTQSMMFLHAVQGFYPMLPLFRRLGIRTHGEIAHERYAIKAMRGNFDQSNETTEQQKSGGRWSAALTAAESAH